MDDRETRESEALRRTSAVGSRDTRDSGIAAEDKTRPYVGSGKSLITGAHD